MFAMIILEIEIINYISNGFDYFNWDNDEEYEQEQYFVSFLQLFKVESAAYKLYTRKETSWTALQSGHEKKVFS